VHFNLTIYIQMPLESLILSGTRAAVEPNWDTYWCKAPWKQLSVRARMFKKKSTQWKKTKV